MRRRVYLEDIPLDEALARFSKALARSGFLHPLPAEDVALEESVGRITAGPVWAKSSSPFYHSAAMDGVAVRAEDTRGARKSGRNEKSVQRTIGRSRTPKFAVGIVRDGQVNHSPTVQIRNVRGNINIDWRLACHEFRSNFQ